MPRVDIKITKTGQIIIDAQDFSGPACLDKTKAFEQLGKLVSRTLKEDYYRIEIGIEQEEEKEKNYGSR